MLSLPPSPSRLSALPRPQSTSSPAWPVSWSRALVLLILSSPLVPSMAAARAAPPATASTAIIAATSNTTLHLIDAPPLKGRLGPKHFPPRHRKGAAGAAVSPEWVRLPLGREAIRPARPG